MEAARGQKHPSDWHEGVKLLKKNLMKVAQKPQNPYNGSNQI